MAKLVVSSLKTRKTQKRAAGSVDKKHMVGADGRVTTLLTLDARSTSFGDDLQYVFERNVSKARRDNKRVLGAADIAPSKR